jgi:hypothetical protein
MNEERSDAKKTKSVVHDNAMIREIDRDHGPEDARDRTNAPDAAHQISTAVDATAMIVAAKRAARF